MNARTRQAQVADELEAVASEMETLLARYGTDKALWPAGQRERFTRIEKHSRALIDEEARLAEDITIRERIAEAARDPRNIESGMGAPQVVPANRTNPWNALDDQLRSESFQGFKERAHDAIAYTPGLTTHARNKLADLIDSDDADAGKAVTVLSDTAYRAAFEKILANPERGVWTLSEQERSAVARVESMRAALSTDVSTGGYLVPLSLQPFAQLTNDGVANPFRKLARHELAVSSPHRVTKTTGITAEWKTEGAEAAEAAPVFGKDDVALNTLSAWVSASYELLQDAPKLVQQLPGLIADAVDRLEGSAFATGSGSGAPLGIVTAISGTSASTVTATTRGSFTSASAVDVFALFNSATPRMRQKPSTVWLMNNAHISTIRQMSTGSQGSLFLSDLSAGTPDALLGHGVHEVSSMSAATTSGTVLAVLADLEAYCIVDHIAGAVMQYTPNIPGTSGGRGTAQAGWHYLHRVGGLVTNIGATRFLKA